MNVQEQLAALVAEVERLDAKSTPGPWTVVLDDVGQYTDVIAPGPVGVHYREYQDFACACRTLLPKLAAVVKVLLEDTPFIREGNYTYMYEERISRALGEQP